MVGCLSSKQSVSVRFRLAVYSLVLYINKEYIIIVEKPPDPRCAYYGCEARSQLAWRSRIKKKYSKARRLCSRQHKFNLYLMYG